MADEKSYAPPTAQERLHEHGPRVLSDVELLTILLGPPPPRGRPR
jgi:DNA repair protein RadC